MGNSVISPGLWCTAPLPSPKSYPQSCVSGRIKQVLAYGYEKWKWWCEEVVQEQGSSTIYSGAEGPSEDGAINSSTQTAFNYPGCGVYASPYLCSPSSCCFFTLQWPISSLSSCGVVPAAPTHITTPHCCHPPFFITFTLFFCLANEMGHSAIAAFQHSHHAETPLHKHCLIAVSVQACILECVCICVYVFISPWSSVVLPAGSCWSVFQGFKLNCCFNPDDFSRQRHLKNKQKNNPQPDKFPGSAFTCNQIKKKYCSFEWVEYLWSSQGWVTETLKILKSPFLFPSTA